MFLEESVASISNAVDRAVYVDSVFIFCVKCVIEELCESPVCSIQCIE